jgi:hypothetical protein
VDKCDIIVCWINNWPECPLEVVELSKIVSSRRAAFSQGRNTYNGDIEARRELTTD